MPPEKLQAYCRLLNAEAITLGEAEGISAWDSLLRTARTNKLNLLRAAGDQSAAHRLIRYETPGKAKLNLWLPTRDGTVGEMGMGFYPPMDEQANQTKRTER